MTSSCYGQLQTAPNPTYEFVAVPVRKTANARRSDFSSWGRGQFDAAIQIYVDNRNFEQSLGDSL